MTFVCARPDLANKALAAHLPIPAEAGFLGVVTLEDLMESVLQDKIYDEGDMRDRDRAVAVLQGWAVSKLQNFVRKRQRRRITPLIQQSSQLNDGRHATESDPLLK
mmetsp:Transcript_9161/g.13367  ORF Transcript_9161/g.13367 Transcript_9161/m.13367 type:complete len:106 (-) Transcript_9161:139-456(-)